MLEIALIIINIDEFKLSFLVAGSFFINKLYQITHILIIIDKCYLQRIKNNFNKIDYIF